MKSKIFFSILFVLAFITGCNRSLDVPPTNVVNEADVFGNASGITAYMARLYSQLPIEDFRWGPVNGFNTSFYGSPSALTGEALSRDQQNSTETFDYWSAAYSLIRDCNIFLQTIPKYASKYAASDVRSWIGEIQFLRGVTYFALAKRYGGVPLVNKVLTKDGATITDLVDSIDMFKLPRNAEDSVYMFVAADLDSAYNNLPETNQAGRVTKYAAAGFKSRAMLFAASIAKYNQITLMDGSRRLCGIPANKAVDYYKASYDAANLLNGKFSLYKTGWSATDKNAQYQCFVNLFFDANSPENVFIRKFKYPNVTHSFDVHNIPFQLGNGSNGAECNPTLDFVEMFEGLPKNPDGTLMTTDANGKYILYNNTVDMFANAEPRLRATVVFPGDLMKGQSIEIRRGIYIGDNTGGINRLIPLGSTNIYPAASIKQSATQATQIPYELPDHTFMNPAGASGYFTGINQQAGSISGFSIRKYLVPDKPVTEMQINRSDQTWIEMRYAEVLLNRAEAAYELYSLGQGANYLATAISDINQIRERAGAALATTITDIDIIRKERRKELAFENKTWWDLRRWRVSDIEQNNKKYRILNPFYSAKDGKYFFDDRYDERNSIYTFDTRWYYKQIPVSAINKSQSLIQNPGY